MSFLKKVTKEFEGLMHENKEDKPQEHNRGYDQSSQYGQSQYSQPQPPQQYGQQPQPYSHAQPYGQPTYSQPPSQYSSPPPQGGYGAPPPPPPPAHEPAPLPQGWFASWDSRRNRPYYFEAATSHTQWEQPGYHSGAPRSEFYQEYGHAMPPTGYGPQGGYGQPGYGPQGGHAENSAQYYGETEQKEKKGVGMGTVLAAGAVGVAGGALVGAALADSDSDDEQRAAPQEPSVYDPVPPPTDDLPDETRSGSSVSSSDKEELEEARQEYEEAYEEAYGDD